jgi:hypothetical protein
MKRVIRIFVLSKSEQRVVLIVVLALIAGTLVRYERRAHQFPVRATTTTEPKAAPSSTEAENER